MATLFRNGIDCPDNQVVLVGRAFGVVQEEDETPAQAFRRLEDMILTHIKQRVKRQWKSEQAAPETLIERIV